MPEPHPNLASFLTFANASVRGRGSIVTRLREQRPGDYSPATDFWRQMRDAVKKDRRTSRDGAAVHAAAINASDRKRQSYARVAEKWDSYIPRWEGAEFEAPLSGVANVAGLQISVAPRFVEAWATHREKVFVYFNAATLSAESTDAALRVIQLAFPNREGESSILLDVQRGEAHHSLSRPVEAIDDQIALLSEEFLARWAA